jgi:O-antigen/teichoic acid export membrane protein
MNSIETLIKKSGEYLDTKIELTKLKAINTSSDVLSNMVYLIVKILIIFLFVGFVSVALAILIGKTIGDYYYGFLIVGGFYLIVLLIIYVQRKKWIKEPVANGLINKMLK